MKLKSPKAKGSEGERDAAKALTKIGIEAFKQPLSGALIDFPYDLRASLNGRRYSVEVKRYNRNAAVEKLRNGADLLLYRADHGEWCAWMPLTTLANLLEPED